MTTLDFEIVGLPAPKGSKRAAGKTKDGRTILVESSKALPAWAESVTDAARGALGSTPEWGAPHSVSVVATFRFRRPRHHYRTGKRAHELRENAPTWHTTKPDIDKLQRATFDAFTAAGVIRDDSIIAHVDVVKVYVNDNEWTGAFVHLSDGLAQ